MRQSVDLPRYRYSKSGEKIDNITDWALKQFKDAYGGPSPLPTGRGQGEGDASRLAALSGQAASLARTSDSQHEETPPHPPLRATFSPGGEGKVAANEDAAHGAEDAKDLSEAMPNPSPQGGGVQVRPITKDAIFHYVYGVLHDPVYRETYAINLKREFPRIPFYPDFWEWAAWGERLMALHIGYESVEPWPLTRIDTPDIKARAAGVPPKAMLKADKDNGQIQLDSETVLSGIPSEVWDYKLGNRCGLEWILDQYKEKKPKDPTIREKFNSYRFADYKEKVIDLLMRVTRVSVETVAITEAMKVAKR